MDKDAIILLANTAFHLAALILALHCLRICHRIRPKKDEPDIPYGSICVSQTTYDEIGPERLRAEMNQPNARVIVIPDNE